MSSLMNNRLFEKLLKVYQMFFILEFFNIKSII